MSATRHEDRGALRPVVTRDSRGEIDNGAPPVEAPRRRFRRDRAVARRARPERYRLAAAAAAGFGASLGASFAPASLSAKLVSSPRDLRLFTYITLSTALP